MIDKEERQKTFKIWLSELDHRIQEWIIRLDDLKLDLNLDYSEESLQRVESFLLKHYDASALSDKSMNVELDAVVSYIGETMKRLIEGARWKIYLDDDTNLFFGLPCILTKYSGAISIHLLLREILTSRSGDILEKRLQKVLAYQMMIAASRKPTTPPSA